MKRYATTAGTFFTEWGQASTSEHIVEQERQVKKTGLVDAHGNEIFSIDETGPVGFVKLKERS